MASAGRLCPEAVAAVLEDEGRFERAAALLDGRPLAAPALWLVEAANVLWRRVRQNELTLREVEERIGLLSAAPVRVLELQELVPDALRLACELDHPVYDCLYLAAAIRCQGQVITADRRFHAAASHSAGLAAMIALL